MYVTQMVLDVQAAVLAEKTEIAELPPAISAIPAIPEANPPERPFQIAEIAGIAAPQSEITKKHKRGIPPHGRSTMQANRPKGNPSRRKSGRKTGPKGPSKPMSRDKFELLKTLIAAYCTKDEISKIMGMSISTLERRLKERGFNFDVFFNQRRATAKAKVRKVMLDMALAGNVPLLIWWSKNHLGMSNKQNVKQEFVGGSQVTIYKLPDNGRD